MSLLLENVTFSYGKKSALLGVSTAFTAGITALLGPNGAGKSTLLELIASVRLPLNGRITLEGVGVLNPKTRKLREYRSNVAWLPQRFVPVPGLTVQEHVAYSAWLKGLKKRDAWARSEHALQMVNLEALHNKPVRSLSGGQQRRVGIAGALVHDAQVILLDEPTAGLDPAQRRAFREVIRTVARDRAVVISSHDTDDAHSAFDNVVILNQGTLVFDGSFEKFVENTNSKLDMRDRVETAYIQRVVSEG